MKKYSFLALILCLSLLVACKPKENLSLPSSDELTSIEFARDNMLNAIDEKKEMDKWLESLVKAEPTKLESVDDYPRVDDFTSISFKRKDGSMQVFHAYEREGKYYLEQPYAGIWEIDKDYYEQINSEAKMGP